MSRSVIPFPGGDGTPRVDPGLHAATVVACTRAAAVCAVSANGFLDDPDVAELRGMIRAALDCADICSALASVLSRNPSRVSSTTRSLLRAAIRACGVCIRECNLVSESVQHGHICARQCRRCEAACLALLEAAAAA